MSILGFWVHKLALGWLNWELTSSPFCLGIVGFSSLFPSFILAPFSYAYVSITEKNKRTDYPGKKISHVVEKNGKKIL